METEREIKRGEIYYADLNPVIGSEQGGIRPVLIIQNDVGNKYSPTVIVTPFTSKIEKPSLPTHIFIRSADSGLPQDSIILLEHIRTIDKARLKSYVGKISSEKLDVITICLSVSFDIESVTDFMYI